MIDCLVDRMQRIIAVSTRISANAADFTREKSAQNCIISAKVR